MAKEKRGDILFADFQYSKRISKLVRCDAVREKDCLFGYSIGYF